jgi:hypothetical protein
VLLEISSTPAANDFGEKNEDYGENSSSSSGSFRAEDVLYFGNSETDNPAFRKAGVCL